MYVHACTHAHGSCTHVVHRLSELPLIQPPLAVFHLGFFPWRGISEASPSPVTLFAHREERFSRHFPMPKKRDWGRGYSEVWASPTQLTFTSVTCTISSNKFLDGKLSSLQLGGELNTLEGELPLRAPLDETLLGTSQSGQNTQGVNL